VKCHKLLVAGNNNFCLSCFKAKCGFDYHMGIGRRTVWLCDTLTGGNN